MKKNNHKGKRLLAGLLSFLMVATTLPFGEMEVKASSLVPNTSLTDNGDRYPYMTTSGAGNNRISYGSSESTGFTFQKMGAGLTGQNTNYDPADLFTQGGYLYSNNIGNTNSFNISAVIDDTETARSGPQKGYTTAVRTAYGKNYWPTYYGFGEPRPNDTINSLTYLTPYITYRGNGITPDDASMQGNDYFAHLSGAGAAAKYKSIDPNSFPVKLFPATYNGGITELQVPGKPAGTKIEVRQEIKPDDDDKNLLVTYTVANTTSDNIKFMIGNESDTFLYNHDKAPILVTKGGKHLHMMANLTNTEVQDLFNNGELASTDNTYKLSDFDVKVKSGEGRVWAGQWPMTPWDATNSSVYHTGFTFVKSRESLVQGYDSAAAFSAFFDLAPGQTKSTTFEVSMRVSVYYVDPTYGDQNGASTGYITKPYKNVQDAIDAIGASGTEKAYIYVMEDTEIPSTLNWNNALNLKSLTIQTSLYDKIGSMSVQNAPGYYGTHPDDMPDGTIKKLIRKNDFTGDLIEVPAGKTLTLTNIEIDGNKAATDTAGTNVTGALVKVEGQLNLKSGTTLINNKVKGTTAKASAIDVEGNGVVAANAGTGTVNITGNESDNKVSAVSLANAMAITGSTPTVYPFTLAGNVNVTGNTTTDTTTNTTTNANIGLGANYLYIPKGAKFTGSVGVNEADQTRLPSSNTEGSTVLDYFGRGTVALPYSISSINPDKPGQTISPGNVSQQVRTGTTINGGTNQLQNVLYLKAPVYSFTLNYADENGNSIPIVNMNFTGNDHIVGTNPYTTSYAAGANIKYDLPTLTGNYAGYVLDRVDIPSVVTTVQSENNASGTPNGNIVGTMGNNSVNITVYFKKNVVRYHFDTQGGNVIANMEENAGASLTVTTLGALPIPTKYGYNFDGWFTYTDNTGDEVYNTGDIDGVAFNGVPPVTGTSNTFPAPTMAGNVYLYAKWTPDPTLHNFTVTHKNSNVALPIDFGSEPPRQYSFTQPITADPLTSIAGYEFNTGVLNPYSAGTVNATSGHVDATMNTTGVDLTYRYKVNPAVTFTYTIHHRDSAGNTLAADQTASLNAEQIFSSQPDTSITGYNYTSFSIVQGGHEDLTFPDYKTGLDSAGFITLNDQTNGLFTAHMPNQNVEITYIYTADSSNNLVRRFFDREVPNSVLASSVDAIAPGSTITNMQIPAIGTTAGDKLYGYIWDGNSTADINPSGSTWGSVNPADGALTGAMPISSTGPIGVDYKLSRDPNKWRAINFQVAASPNNEGSIGALFPGVPTTFLGSDGTALGDRKADTFNKLNAQGSIPGTVANRYYKFDGWYMDAAATIPVVGTYPLPSDTATAGSTPLTLYAKFIEDPSMWIDINFAANANGSVGTPATLHKPYDYTWGQIQSDLPSTIPVVNYNFANWSDSANNAMTATSPLVNNATYYANFTKDPVTWGLTIGSIVPTGHLGNDGSGEIRINGTTPGNVYVISDKNGKIVAVVTGEAIGSITNVPNLIPGAHYDVQEGTPDTIAVVGNPTSSITSSNISAPIDTYIPTVDNNYSVGYDPENDGMAEVVINPADPDADYALIDENGNVINYPGSDNGWIGSSGNPSIVTFKNLNPNETYTVVARRKGDTSITDPLSKLPDGNAITANPGDMADAPKYIVEAVNGEVVMVGANSVNAVSFDNAKAGDIVNLHADMVNSAGYNFKYWQVLAGRAVGVTGKILDNDYSFTMSNSNIVFKAVYDLPKIAADDADADEEIRGGAVGEFGLDPNQIPALAHDLTSPQDQSLIGINGAKVDYRVIFSKRNASNAESALVKPVSISGVDHPDAYTAAYALDIELERYVDGRKVGRATDSNASIDVTAQLPAADTDQLDYEIFDVTTGTPVAMSYIGDLDNNAGLFKFTANINHTYVLVYSKIFKVVFVDNKPVLDYKYLNDTSRNFYHKFKVRRKEAVEDTDYSLDYSLVQAYADGETAGNLVTPFEDIYGVEYNYKNWSKKENSLSVFDPSINITKAMTIYAYYENNKPKVDKARVDLRNTIQTAKDLLGDPYLKAGEADTIREKILEAMDTLAWARGILDKDGIDHGRMANYAELQRAIDGLLDIINRYSNISNGRIADRNRRTGGASGGGNSSAGRGSILLTPGEKNTIGNKASLEGSNVTSFILGTDGKWETNPVTGGWSFVLNGGLPLNSSWAKIQIPDSHGKLVSRWYFFDSRSTMVTGWMQDPSTKNWYFMNTGKGALEGQMVLGWVLDTNTNKWYYMDEDNGVMTRGWHKDPQDGRWYYMDNSGAMLTGWQNIGGKNYFFNPVVPAPTYEWNSTDMRWDYVKTSSRPYGSMYENEKTPDGYTVNANGERLQ
ncbi:InlB B-repeat-containing protein [Lachnoanaerobaculum gingivalis]|uniref:InlB B-repeat-containing protein n=1 Tax=Lachnoanaerobaculum gingivalis TaxID=2490855 RepID=UPI0024A685F8|nr:InlB B-repeat-containing protein [Lachnoanaerobaculum gingivalis]WHE88502.1 InlB B-repeat-containing protein [Lachnoanaerobaculum gingivalis]